MMMAHLISAVIILITLVSLQTDENMWTNMPYSWSRYKLPVWVWILTVVCLPVYILCAVEGIVAIMFTLVCLFDKICRVRDQQLGVRTWWLGGYSGESKLKNFLTKKI